MLQTPVNPTPVNPTPVENSEETVVPNPLVSSLTDSETVAISRNFC